MSSLDKQEAVDRLEGKTGKEHVNYRLAEDDINCDACINYQYHGQPRSPCAIVAGVVYADDVCDAWDDGAGDQGDPQSQPSLIGEI